MLGVMRVVPLAPLRPPWEATVGPVVMREGVVMVGEVTEVLGEAMAEVVMGVDLGVTGALEVSRTDLVTGIAPHAAFTTLPPVVSASSVKLLLPSVEILVPVPGPLIPDLVIGSALPLGVASRITLPALSA